MQLCQILALCTKEVPSREAAPEKFVRGCEATAIPTPAGTWPVLGFYTIMVLPLDAMGRNATQCQGATKSPCRRECCALPRGQMAPSQVADGPSACPLPFPFPRGEPCRVSTDLRPWERQPGKAGGWWGAARGSLLGCPDP